MTTYLSFSSFPRLMSANLLSDAAYVNIVKSEFAWIGKYVRGQCLVVTAISAFLQQVPPALFNDEILFRSRCTSICICMLFQHIFPSGRGIRQD
jgi:hypothetical protein